MKKDMGYGLRNEEYFPIYFETNANGIVPCRSKAKFINKGSSAFFLNTAHSFKLTHLIVHDVSGKAELTINKNLIMGDPVIVRNFSISEPSIYSVLEEVFFQPVECFRLEIEFWKNSDPFVKVSLLGLLRRPIY